MLTLKKQHSTIEAAISAPNPPVTGASWLIYMPFIDHQDTHQPASMKHSQKEITLTRSLPVFLTEASTVSLSQGIRVFRSISSQEIPSWKILMLISVSTVFYFYFFFLSTSITGRGTPMTDRFEPSSCILQERVHWDNPHG